MASRLTNGLKVLAVSVLASVIYGIAHDLMSTQVCLEYFTVYHPQIVDSENPLVLALFWGVVATWWVGFILGTGLAFVSNWGERMPLPARTLVRPLAIGLVILLAAAMLTWAVAYGLATLGPSMVDASQSRMPSEEDRRVAASAVAHLVSYGGSVFLAVGLSLWAWRARQRLG